jgi:aryl-alcohol dehydrogenase-like predicted oxidoreductase
MRTARIGSLEVSLVGLGCNNFGRALDAEGSAEVARAALDVGMTYFDTASNYGDGQSEAFLGAALGPRREEVVIGTKFGVGVPGWDGSGGASPQYVRRAVERSLQQLDTEYIDLLMIHFPDPKTPIEDTLFAMQELVDAGKVREIGCSNFSGDQLHEADQASTDLGVSHLVCDQVEFSLVHREPETDDTLETCRRLGVALLPYYPLASGLLTGKTKRGQAPKGRLSMERYQRFLTDANFDLVERLESYAAEHSITMPQLALGWLLSVDGLPAVTAGATTREQVQANARAADWAPSREDLEQLNALIAG